MSCNSKSGCGEVGEKKWRMVYKWQWGTVTQTCLSDTSFGGELESAADEAESSRMSKVYIRGKRERDIHRTRLW